MLRLQTGLITHGKTENVVYIHMHVYTCVNTEVGEKPPTYQCVFLQGKLYGLKSYKLIEINFREYSRELK